ncbi:ATPase [Aureococcus anophagefferens]|nr:ATPase [Aureococcus anophagefferens]
MAPRFSAPVITLKEVMMGGANRKGHRCAPCGGGSAVLQSLADKAKRFAFLWGVVLVLGATYVTLHTRDAFFERGRGVLVSCDSLRDGDGATPDTLEEWVDFFRDPDEFYNATVSALLETFGSGGLTADEFYANHCDGEQLRKLANARKPVDARDPRCAFESDASDAACAGGLFRWRYDNGEPGDVDAAPEGFFSPEFQTCLVRCAAGGYCPRSNTTNPRDTKCRYPGSVDKSIASHKVGGGRRVCPGSKHLYLCPAGSYCRDSAQRHKCHTNHACPTGSTRGARCHALFHGGKSSVPCEDEGLKFPDYSETCALFVATVACLLLLVRALTSSKAARAKGASLAKALQEIDAAAGAAARDAFGLTTTTDGDASSPKSVVDDELGQDAPFYSLSFEDHAKVVFFAGGAALTLMLVSVFHNGVAVAAVLFAAVSVFGCCGLCHYDVIAMALRSESGAVWTCCGCARRSHVALCVVFGVVFAAAATVYARGGSYGTQWNLVVAGFLAAVFLVGGAAAAGFAAVEARRDGAARPSLEGRSLSHLPSCSRDVSGSVVSGSVTAIMGPSGAGKTTLMSVLADRAGGYGVTTGDIAVHVGGERHAGGGLGRLSSLVAFVPQDDVMLPELTVRQTLTFYAAIKADRPLSSAEIDQRVADVLRIVLLARSTHDVVIGDAERRGISGGQKKRVNVAMEIVSNPSLLFLDEPTSGLDSATSAHVVGALLELARRGVNVVVVLHQPSFALFSSFTHIVLLGVGGRMVYHGPPAAAEPYFRSLGYALPEFSNPADYYMEILSGLAKPAGVTEGPAAEVLAGTLAAVWDASELAAEDVALKPEGVELTYADDVPAGRGWWAEAFLFARRALLQELMKPGDLAFDVLLLTGTGATFGSQSANVEVASLPTMIVWVGIGLQLFLAVTSLRVFGSERLVHWRETTPGSGMALSASAYFFGKDLVQIPRLAILVLSFTVPFYTLATPDPTLPFVFACFYLLSYAVSGYAYMASVVVGPKDAQLLVVCVSLVLVMLSPPSERLETTNEDFFTRLLTWLSPIRWAGETLIVKQTRHLSHAWKMPPYFYGKPQRESALAIVLGFTFHEGWLYDLRLKETPNNDGVCEIDGKWIKNDPTSARRP